MHIIPSHSLSLLEKYLQTTEAVPDRYGCSTSEDMRSTQTIGRPSQQAGNITSAVVETSFRS